MFGWRWICTEIDIESIKLANELIQTNHLSKSISILPVERPDILLINVLPSEGRFDFCVCNPPFFSDEDEAIRTNPNTICTGSQSELVIEGGEVGFITKLIKESLILRDRVCWFSTMLGKKSSLSKLKSILVGHGITIIHTTELLQAKTTRWILAWTFVTTATPEFSIEYKEKLRIRVKNISLKSLHETIMTSLKSNCKNVIKKDHIGQIHASLESFTFHFQIIQIQPHEFLVEIISKKSNLPNTFIPLLTQIFTQITTFKNTLVEQL